MSVKYSQFQSTAVRKITKQFPQANCRGSDSKEAVLALIDQEHTLLIVKVAPATLQIEIVRKQSLHALNQHQSIDEAITFAVDAIRNKQTIVNKECQSLTNLIDW